MKKTREMDLLRGPLLGNLIRFALPIALSSMLQQLFNAMDTSVVGRFADANALTILGTCVLRIVWSFTVFERFGTLESLYIVFPISWCATTVLVWAGYASVRPLKQA